MILSLLCILQEDPGSFLLHNSYAIFAANPLLFLSRQEVCSSLNGHVLRNAHMGTTISKIRVGGQKKINNEASYLHFLYRIGIKECYTATLTILVTPQLLTKDV